MMKSIRDLSARDLARLFREATTQAAREALDAGRSITGMDREGRVVSTRQPQPSAEAKKDKQSNRRVA